MAKKQRNAMALPNLLKDLLLHAPRVHQEPQTLQRLKPPLLSSRILLLFSQPYTTIPARRLTHTMLSFSYRFLTCSSAPCIGAFLLNLTGVALVTILLTFASYSVPVPPQKGATCRGGGLQCQTARGASGWSDAAYVRASAHAAAACACSACLVPLGHVGHLRASARSAGAFSSFLLPTSPPAFSALACPHVLLRIELKAPRISADNFFRTKLSLAGCLYLLFNDAFSSAPFECDIPPDDTRLA